MQLTKGTRLGPYQIIAPIGAGGMGEVYHARDTRLNRDVAIKILAPDFFDDSTWRMRFERESRAIASLNHPNICAVYDVGTAPVDGRGDAPFIVMEYLQGETLESRLKRGPLTLDEALRYGAEIADALDKAHGMGILHRDVKPSNIILTKTGARLFDFGLAKFVHKPKTPVASDQRPLSQESTAEKTLTAEGSVIGTLDYMSPELLHGTEPDARTDVFSLGVCLYQMVTGKRPFQGNSRASLIAAILDHAPAPPSTYQRDVPPALDWLIANCLAKDPDDRIQTAHDVALMLRRITAERRIAPQSSPRLDRRTLFYAAAVLLVVATAIVALRLGRRRTSRPIARKQFVIALPPSAAIANGHFEKLAVSADGSRIAYVGGENPTRLYVYSLDTLETRALPGTEGAKGPFFSPQGDWVGFYTDEHELRKVSIDGGQPVTVCRVGDVRGATWGDDDTIVYAELGAPLHRVPAAGGTPEPLPSFEGRSQIRWPEFLPGKSVLYTANDLSGNYENAEIAVMSLEGGGSRMVLRGGTCGRYVSSGYLLYLHSGGLYAVPFDTKRLRSKGEPQRIVADVDFYFSTGLAHFSVASDGSLFYIPRNSNALAGELVWADRSGATTPITSLHNVYGNPKLAPDGKAFVVEVGESPRQDLWSYDFSRGSFMRLTTEGTNENPVWSPDGSQIAFASNTSGGFHLYTMRSDGSAPAKLLIARQAWDFPTSWSPDGNAILVMEPNRTTLRDIFAVMTHEPAAAKPVVSTPFDESDAAFAPNGHWIAYRSNESGNDEIYVQPYPPNGQRQRISYDGGRAPVWRGDGHELFYRSGDRLMAVETRFQPKFSASKPAALFRGEFDDEFDVTRNGSRFLMIKLPKQPPPTEIKVVFGLFDNK